MPELPNIHILFVLVLTFVALALFAAAPYSLQDGGTYDPIRFASLISIRFSL